MGVQSKFGLESRAGDMGGRADAKTLDPGSIHAAAAPQTSEFVTTALVPELDSQAVTYVGDYTAILWPTRGDPATTPKYLSVHGLDQALNGVQAKPTFITWSLSIESPDYLFNVAEYDKTALKSVADGGTFRTFTEAERAKVLEAIAMFEAVSGIKFLEVAPGQADMNFMIYNLKKLANTDAAGFAVSPDNGGMVPGKTSSDVFMDSPWAGDLGVLLHEIGHALGLKHPFEGDVQLSATYDHKNYTVMSYAPEPVTGLGTFDGQALQFLYGTAAQRATEGTGQGQYQWNPVTHTLTQYGTDQKDYLIGTGAADILYGYGGDDVIRAKFGANTVYGGTGNDTIYTSGDPSSLYGEADNDIFVVQLGASLSGYGIDGGEGIDSLDLMLSDATRGRTIKLSDLNIRNVETIRLIGGDGKDDLSADIDLPQGTSGTITLAGGKGNDTLRAGGSTTNMFGGDGDDVLIAGRGAGAMDGGAGVDRFVFNSALDSTHAARDFIQDFQVGIDKIVLGFKPAGGLNFAYFSGQTTISGTHNGVAFELQVNGSVTASDIEYANAPTGPVTPITGTPGDDNPLNGTPGSDVIYGLAGNDVINGNGGADKIYAGDGDDTTNAVLDDFAVDAEFDGGAGTDLLVLRFADQSAGKTLNLSSVKIVATENVDVVGTSLDDVFTADIGTTGIVKLFGYDGNDTLVGGGTQSALFGGIGNDTLIAGKGFTYMEGGDGADRFVFNTPSSSTAAVADYIKDFVRGTDKIVLGFTPATITFRPAINNGNTFGTVIEATHDGISFQIVAETVGITMDDIELAGAPVATPRPAATVSGVNGTAGNDVIYGTEAGETLSGWGGIDKIYAGGGNDMVWVDVGPVTTGYELDGGDGSDFLGFNLSGNVARTLYLSGVKITNFETIQVSAGSGNDYLVADLPVNGWVILNGGAGDDILKGGKGNTVLNGGDGADTLFAGSGYTAMDGGAADGKVDRFVFGSATDTLSTAADDVRGFELGTDRIVLNFTPDQGTLRVDPAIGDYTDNGVTTPNVHWGTIISGMQNGVAFTIRVYTPNLTLGSIDVIPGKLANSSDGYLVGATVWQDTNGNGDIDAGEYTTTTMANGDFLLPEGGSGPLRLVGGTNSDTGLPNFMVMSAPAGSTVINPLTTILVEMMEHFGTSLEDAQMYLKSALFISPDIDLTQTDVLGGAYAGDETMLWAQKIAVSIANLITVATHAGIDPVRASADILSTLAFIARYQPGLQDLTDPAVVTNIYNVAGLEPIADQAGAAAAAANAGVQSAPTIQAVSTAQHDGALTGTGLNDALTGGTGADIFNLSQGGEDSADGGDGSDGFYMGGAWSAGDRLTGGAGTDQVGVQGNTNVVLGANSLSGVEQIVFLPGSDTRFGDLSGALYSYSVTTHDANVAAGQTLTVQANTLRAGESLTFNGAAEQDGKFLFYGGMGSDVLTGGQLSDGFFFGAGRFNAGDVIDGQGGDMDQMGLQGDYSDTSAITFGANQLVSIEMIVLLSGADARFNAGGSLFNYTLTMHDNNALAGTMMTIQANTLRAGEVLTLDASAETDAAYRVYGGSGDDHITGGALADQIWGGAGNDAITGGGGADQLYGGAGNDVFVYRATTDSDAQGRDHIHDFEAGDAIDLSALGLTTFGAFGAGLAGQVRAYWTGEVWNVEGDIDGDGNADISILVDASSGYQWSASDFHLSAGGGELHNHLAAVVPASAAWIAPATGGRLGLSGELGSGPAQVSVASLLNGDLATDQHDMAMPVALAADPAGLHLL